MTTKFKDFGEKEVKELMTQTGESWEKCRKSLLENLGDMKRAIKWLTRQKMNH